MGDRVVARQAVGSDNNYCMDSSSCRSRLYLRVGASPGPEERADGARAAGIVLVGLSLGVLLSAVSSAPSCFLHASRSSASSPGFVLYQSRVATISGLVFPLAFLLLMIPLPAIIFNQIAFPLQLLASRAGGMVIGLAGIPVVREGNVL